MQLTANKSFFHNSEFLTMRFFLLCLFGFILALLVLNSHVVAILFPFAILIGFGLIVAPNLAYLAIVMSIPIALELFAGLTVTTAVLPVAFLSLALNASIHRCRWPISFSSSEELAAVFYFFILIVSSFLAEIPMGPFQEVVAAGVFFIIFMTTTNYIEDEDSIKRVMWVLIAMGIIESIITVAQVKIGFIMPGQWRLNNLVETDVTEEFRADGTTAHPIQLGHYLQFTIMVGIAELFRNRNVLVKCFLFMGTALMVLGWYYAFSRTSFIAMAVTLVAYLFFIRGRFWRILISASALFLVFLVLIMNIRSAGELVGTIERLNVFSSSISHLKINSGQDSFGFRMEQFYAAWWLFLDNPIIGVGYEQANPRYMPYLPGWAVNYVHPQVIHNIFFKMLCELGILGFSAFVALWYFAINSLRLAWSDEQYGYYAKMVFLILVGQLVMGGMNPILREIWLSLGLATAIGKIIRIKNKKDSTAIIMRGENG